MRDNKEREGAVSAVMEYLRNDKNAEQAAGGYEI